MIDALGLDQGLHQRSPYQDLRCGGQLPVGLVHIQVQLSLLHPVAADLKGDAGGGLQGNILRRCLQGGKERADLFILRQILRKINGFRGNRRFLPVQIINLIGLSLLRLLPVSAGAEEKKEKEEKNRGDGPDSFFS